MRRKLPGTELLIAFETAARHQSFTRAAEELSLTQSAVCRQISALEEFLGVQLFNRIKKRVSPLRSGAALRAADPGKLAQDRARHAVLDGASRRGRRS